jgi:hypothetical protein
VANGSPKRQIPLGSLLSRRRSPETKNALGRFSEVSAAALLAYIRESKSLTDMFYDSDLEAMLGRLIRV